MKKFIIWGNNNAITYKDVFPLIKEGYIKTGRLFNKPQDFTYPDGKIYNIKSITVFTSFDIDKTDRKLILSKKYNPKDYPKYDNYDAINVDKVSDIPVDYDGVMGVPITFLGKYCPEQFEIIGMSASAGYNADIVGIPFIGVKDARCIVNGKNVYARIIIRRRTFI